MNLIKSTWSFNGRVATAWVLLVRSLVVLVLCIASSRVALTQQAYSFGGSLPPGRYR